MANTLSLYRRHSQKQADGRKEWECEYRDSKVFEARPHPVKVGTAKFTMLVHEPDPKLKRELAKDCKCPIVCDGSLANERNRIRRRSLGTNDWEEAKALAAQWLAWGQLMEPFKAALPAIDEVSVELAIERFSKSKGPEGENIDYSTLRKYHVLLKDRLLPWCRAHDIRTVAQLENKTLCEDFVHSWRNLNPNKNRRNVKWSEKLLSRTTKVAELGRFRYFLEYCVDSGWITKNVAKKIKVESRGKGDPRYGLNPDEYDRVVEEAGLWTDGWGNRDKRKAKELQVMVPLLRWSGLRISDAAVLSEKQVRKVGGRYVIVIEHMEKTGSTVRVPIPAFIGDALLAFPLKGSNPQGHRCWFWTGAGKAQTCVNAWRNDIAESMRRAQKPDSTGTFQQPFEHKASTHTLRHTFACMALAGGATLLQVKEWLGHTSVKTTEKHYGHANTHAQTVLDRAYDAMVDETMKAETPKVPNVVSIRSAHKQE